MNYKNMLFFVVMVMGLQGTVFSSSNSIVVVGNGVEAVRVTIGGVEQKGLVKDGIVDWGKLADITAELRKAEFAAVCPAFAAVCSAASTIATPPPSDSQSNN